MRQFEMHPYSSLKTNKMRKYILKLLILAVVILSLFYLKSDYKRAAPTVYFNANIITLDDENPTAEAMLVIDGKIAAIGKEEAVTNAATKGVQRIDLKGQTVLPGFIDVHTHFALSMFLAEMHDLSGFTHADNEAVWQHFEDAVANSAPGEWVICKGIDPILIKDLRPPTMQYLDSIAPQNPVVIFSQSLHNYWGNSRAFEKAGVNNQTKNPSTHSYYEKDDAGKFTGLIVEQEAFLPFIEVLKNEVLTGELLSRVSSKVMFDYAKNGNTSLVSTGLTINDSKPLILLRHLSNESPTLLGAALAKIGQLPSRRPTPRHFMYMRHDMLHLLPKAKGKQNDFYDIIGVKHWYDGSPYIGSMYMEAPYLENELTTDKLKIPKNAKGKALISQEDLEKFIRQHHSKGWQIAIHTQGDAAIKEVVHAFNKLDAELDFSQSRHRLEHCLMLPKTELNSMKKLNLTPSFHINHLYYYGEALHAEMLGEQRTNGILPVHSAIENDIVVSLHADQPMFESKPFRLIQTAAERKTDEGKIINANEKIDVMEAIKALTINAAWQINMEDKIGSLEKNKYADFIILDKNPLEVSIEQLENIKCVETFVNGNKIIE